MPDSISLFELVNWSPLHLLIPLMILQRIWELRLAKRHEKALRARGAVEAGAPHYPQIVALHVLWFIGICAEIFFLSRQINPFWPALLLIALLAQVLRYWTIRTLGERWTTRVLVVPGAKAVTGGPFKLVRHPNYVAVMFELFFFPLIFGAYVTAITVSIINAFLLRKRIVVEEKALKEIGKGYENVGREGTGVSSL
jgi:methyltransferase